MLCIVFKIDTSKRIENFLQIMNTILEGLLSGIVAFSIAFFEINNYKKEQANEKKTLEIRNKKDNINRLERLLVEIQDNKVVFGELDLTSNDIKESVVIIRLSLSDSFWKLNINDIDASEELLFHLFVYYKNVHIIQTCDAGYINSNVVNSFSKKQDEVINYLEKEIKTKKEEIE